MSSFSWAWSASYIYLPLADPRYCLVMVGKGLLKSLWWNPLCELPFFLWFSLQFSHRYNGQDSRCYYTQANILWHIGFLGNILIFSVLDRNTGRNHTAGGEIITGQKLVGALECRGKPWSLVKETSIRTWKSAISSDVRDEEKSIQSVTYLLFFAGQIQLDGTQKCLIMKWTKIFHTY